MLRTDNMRGKLEDGRMRILTCLSLNVQSLVAISLEGSVG